MISGSNEQLQQELEWTLLKPDCHKMQSGREDTLEERGLICRGFNWVQEEIQSEDPAFFKSIQWHFHQDNSPVYNSIHVTDYFTKMGINTVCHPPYSPDLAPCDFWLFPKLRGYRYETIEELKEAVTKVIDTLTREDFHGAFLKLLERYKCIAAGADYFEGD